MDGISRDFKWFVENELVSRIEKGVDKTCEKSVDHLHVKDIAFIQVAQLLVDDLFDMIEDTSPVLQGLERHLRVRHDALLKELIPAKKIKVDENPQIPKGATQRFAQPPHHSSEDDDSLEDEDTPYELVLHFEPFKDHKESPEDTILDTLRRTELTADSIDSVLENTALLISLLRNGDYSPDDLDNPVEDFRDFIHSKWKPKRIRGLLKSDFSKKVQQLIALLEPIVGDYYL